MDLYTVPPEYNKLSEIRNDLYHELKGEYYIELRRFDLWIENTLEMGIVRHDKSSPKYMEIRISIAQNKVTHRRIKLDELTVDLDHVRSAIRDLLKAAKDRGLSRGKRVFKPGAVPEWMVGQLFAASKDVIEWFDKFCPEILLNRNLSELRSVMVSMKAFEETVKG